MMSDKKIAHYFELANNTCLYSNNKKARVGCILVYKNKVISVGWNVSDKEHPMQKKLNALRGYDPDVSGERNTLHAEMMALLKARGLDIDFGKASLFVCRIRKDGSKGMAKPCEACTEMIKSLGVRDVYYTTNDGWNFERRSNGR